MKTFGFVLVAIIAVVAGLVVGALNPSAVQIDLLWSQVRLPLGLAILLGFSLGVLVGVAALYLSGVLPLRLQLHKARQALTTRDTPKDVPE